MLQQTQVATVLPYFERWMARFPTVAALAAADEADVLACWQGLGYYRRARYLMLGARFVVEHGMPTDELGWRRVPGVGPYTAGAIASIAFGQRSAVVDGNVERVFARLAGSRTTGAELHREAWTWARDKVNRERPGDWNQALMELGATICRPVRPECGKCPAEALCVARQSLVQDQLPVKSSRPTTVALRHAVWVPYHDGAFGLRQIAPGQWWEGLWEFPRTDSPETGEVEVPLLRRWVGPGWIETLGVVRHAVTHHRITIAAALVHCEGRSADMTWFRREDLDELPLPSPQRKILGRALSRLFG